MGNSFKEQSPDLLVLDTHNIKDKDAVNTVNSIETLGKKNQFQEFLQSRIKTKQKSIFEPIKRNKLPPSPLTSYKCFFSIATCD